MIPSSGMKLICLFSSSVTSLSLVCQLMRFKGWGKVSQYFPMASVEYLKVCLTFGIQARNYSKLIIPVPLLSIFRNSFSADDPMSLMYLRMSLCKLSIRSSFFLAWLCSWLCLDWYQNTFTSMVPTFTPFFLTSTLSLMGLSELDDSTRVARGKAAVPTTSESLSSQRLALSSKTVSSRSFFLRQFLKSSLQTTSSILQCPHFGCGPFSVLVQQSSILNGQYTNRLDWGENPAPSSICTISFLLGVSFSSAIDRGCDKMWEACSQMGRRILMSKLMVPITFWFKIIGVDVFITGATFGLFFSRSCFRGTSALPRWQFLLPYAAQMLILKVPLAMKRQKNSSSLSLKANSELKMVLRPWVGLLFSVLKLQKSTVAITIGLLIDVMLDTLRTSVSIKLSRPRKTSKQFTPLVVPIFQSLNMEMSPSYWTPCLEVQRAFLSLDKGSMLIWAIISSFSILIMVSFSLQASSMDRIRLLASMRSLARASFSSSNFWAFWNPFIVSCGRRGLGFSSSATTWTRSSFLAMSFWMTGSLTSFFLSSKFWVWSYWSQCWSSINLFCWSLFSIYSFILSSLTLLYFSIMAFILTQSSRFLSYIPLLSNPSELSVIMVIFSSLSSRMRFWILSSQVWSVSSSRALSLFQSLRSSASMNLERSFQSQHSETFCLSLVMSYWSCWMMFQELLFSMLICYFRSLVFICRSCSRRDFCLLRLALYSSAIKSFCLQCQIISSRLSTFLLSPGKLPVLCKVFFELCGL